MAKFRAKLLLEGKTATGIEVPAKVVESLGAGKRPAVAVKLHKYTYRTHVAPMGGRFLIPVAAEVRERSGVKAGDTLEVTIELDTAPRVVKVPPDLAKALKAEGLAAAFAKLSYTNQKEAVVSLESAKKPETRQRRLEKTLASLRD